jgi:hypothetical protein
MYDQHDRRILISSTPKTGNTWLKHLLAAAYGLPMARLDDSFVAEAADRLGPRWIAHQHYDARSDALNWAARTNTALVTTVRHPGDVLISFYHHVHRYASTTPDFGAGWRLLLDSDSLGSPGVRAYVRQYYHTLLNISIGWIYSRTSCVVRYEDLQRDPEGALARVCARIAPVSSDTIARAVEQSEIGVLRRLAVQDSGFFRQGGVGEWRDVLPGEVVDILRTVDPYPAQLAALGYSFDLRDAPLAAPAVARRSLNRISKTFDRVTGRLAAPAVARRSLNPFRGATHFDNGVPVPAVAERLYLSFPTAEAQGRWPNVLSTADAGSFFRWLNAPAGPEPDQPADVPRMTNLSLFVGRSRHEFQVSGRHSTPADVCRFGLWFVRRAAKEYGLDRAFVQPVAEHVAAWATTQANSDPERASALPIGNLAALIYSMRPDLQKLYPEPFGAHRAAYLHWFAMHAAADHELDADIVAPIREQFAAWAEASDPNDSQWDESLPRITNLAAYLHGLHAEARRVYPDIYGRDRLDYLLWFTRLPEAQAFCRSVIGSLARACVVNGSALGQDARQR